jgi:hypothetical protein
MVEQFRTGGGPRGRSGKMNGTNRPTRTTYLAFRNKATAIDSTNFRDPLWRQDHDQ